MSMGRKLALVAGAAAVATTAIATTAIAQQKVTGPSAVYWMSAQTQTGFGMPSMGAGGGQPDPSAMMRAVGSIRAPARPLTRDRFGTYGRPPDRRSAAAAARIRKASPLITGTPKGPAGKPTRSRSAATRRRSAACTWDSRRRTENC